MKVIGIIAEFNPLHYGHKYLIDEAKRLTQADFCIVVMSGNFVQRGAPALVNKYSRSRMALLNGADLIIELPVCYATGSAEYFSRAAVRLLDKLGVVDFLCFGSECGDIDLLKGAANLLGSESELLQERIRENLRKGLSYPKARSYAIDSCSQSFCLDFAKDSGDVPEINDQLIEIINQPNNILGIEYIKALRFFDSSIIPVTVKRKGSGYHEEQIKAGEFCSATAVRKKLFEMREEDTGTPNDGKEGDKNKKDVPLFSYVPENTLALLSSLDCLINEDDFSALLYYKLIVDAESGYTRFFDISNDLSDKIRKNLNDFTAYKAFINKLKSKDLTYMRISRCLCHILLDIFSDDVNCFIENDYIFYARLLGFNEKSAALLHEIKKKTSVPLISKLADAERLLGQNGMTMLRKDIQSSHIYNLILKEKGGNMGNEYTMGVIKV